MGIDTTKKFAGVSIIGAGYMAEEHIKAIQKIKKLKILGIMSRKKANAVKLARKYKIKRVYDNIDEMFSKTSSKLLVIAVSETSIKNIILKSLKHSWKIFTEKPLGLNFNESETIFKKCKLLRRTKDITIGFNRRNYDTTKFVLKDIDKSKNRLVQIFDQQNIFDKSVMSQPKIIRKNWMYANSVHLIDYANIFCRGKISSSKKNTFSLGKQTKIISFTAKYTSGDILIYNALWNIPGPWSVVVSNKKKSYKLEPLESLLIKDSKSRKYKKIAIVTKDEKLGTKIGLFNQTSEFLNFINNKEHNLSKIKESHETMSLTKKIYS